MVWRELQRAARILPGKCLRVCNPTSNSTTDLASNSPPNSPSYSASNPASVSQIPP